MHRVYASSLIVCQPHGLFTSLLQAKTVQPKPGTEERGQIVQTETPVHHSNVMHWSKEQKVRSRIRQQCVLSPIFCLKAGHSLITL